MLRSLIKADTQIIDSKHTGKFIGNLMMDAGMINNLISVAILNLFKDSLNSAWFVRSNVFIKTGNFR